MTQAELTYGTIMKTTIVECAMIRAVLLYLWHSYEDSTFLVRAMVQARLLLASRSVPKPWSILGQRTWNLRWAK
jgi:hypothetical protein